MAKVDPNATLNVLRDYPATRLNRSTRSQLASPRKGATRARCCDVVEGRQPLSEQVKRKEAIHCLERRGGREASGGIVLAQEHEAAGNLLWIVNRSQGVNPDGPILP